MKKLMFQWGEIKSTFWFVPAIIILFSMVLSLGLVYLDGILVLSQQGLGRFFFVNSPESARSVLSTISGAMMGVAGTVFSITLVVLTLASSQFGPRLIKNFMYVRLNQVVLGSYISTYLYCLFVLSSVKHSETYTFIPSLSILVAILAAVANIILLIIFIHQIAISIQADKVISDISNFIAHQVKLLFPEKTEEELMHALPADVESAKSGYKKKISVVSPRNGYIQYIDIDALLRSITKQQAFFELFHRPGSHLVMGEEIGILHYNQEELAQELEEILRHFVFGKTKTAQQDIEFSIHQLVEIAARALSPGVNDPYTAIACIDNLTATMVYLTKARFPSKYQADNEGNLRLELDALDFEGVLDAAFNQIRQYSGGSTAVIIRLMEALITIHALTTKVNQRKAIEKHAKMVLNMGKLSIKEPNDVRDLELRAKQIVAEQG